MSPSIGESGGWERENKKRRLLVAEYPFWARLQIDEISFVLNRIIPILIRNPLHRMIYNIGTLSLPVC